MSDSFSIYSWNRVLWREHGLEKWKWFIAEQKGAIIYQKRGEQVIMQKNIKYIKEVLRVVNSYH